MNPGDPSPHQPSPRGPFTGIYSIREVGMVTFHHSITPIVTNEGNEDDLLLVLVNVKTDAGLRKKMLESLVARCRDSIVSKVPCPHFRLEGSPLRFEQNRNAEALQKGDIFHPGFKVFKGRRRLESRHIELVGPLGCRQRARQARHRQLQA
ncbi:unnamed protein product [Somion occarium]|uniref:Uncharacterized protein n=1 Tax=Somion occarium TaxID=3059160 RepID=A0ABP1CUS4_9APHY